MLNHLKETGKSTMTRKLTRAFHPRTRLFSISQSVSRGSPFVIVLDRCVSSFLSLATKHSTFDGISKVAYQVYQAIFFLSQTR